MARKKAHLSKMTDEEEEVQEEDEETEQQSPMENQDEMMQDDEEDHDDQSSSESQDSEATHQNTRPKKKKKKHHSHVVIRDFKGDLEKAGALGKISEMGVSLVLLFAAKDATVHLALTCKWMYSVYLGLRSYSLDFIRLEYLNSRCTQYKYLTSLFTGSSSANNSDLDSEPSTRKEKVPGIENMIAFEPVDIMKDDPTLILPNKFSQRRSVLINLFQDFTQEDIMEGNVIRKESPFHKMNLLRWQNFEVENIDEFKNKVHDSCSSMVRILLDCLWRHNASNKEQFIIAGGFVLKCLRKGNHEYGWGDTSDVDIFCIQNGESKEKCHFSLRKILFEFEKLAKEDGHTYAIVKNNGCLNIHGKSTSNIAQFILRRVDTIEELMTFFDIDCCRFCYDGTHVYTVREGINSVSTTYNFVSSEHREKGMYTNRAYKYGKRGYTTWFTNDHPLDHFHDCSKKIARINEKLNSGEIEDESECLYGDGVDKEDLEGLYSVFNNLSLSYKLVMTIRRIGVKNFLAIGWENYYGGMWDIDFDSVSLDEIEAPESTEFDEFVRRVTSDDIHYFCVSVRELYMKDASIFFTDYYFDSHLRGKYNFWKCYCCGFYRHSSDVDFSMCDTCKLFNSSMKKLKRDLTGKVAIVTGGRIKIGFMVAKTLLENGATVIVTTRFAHNAHEKFLEYSDYEEWKSRLFIYPLNLKDGASIMSFCAYIRNNFKRIDYLINNAAQTVRRPLKYYSKLLKNEKKHLDEKYLGEIKEGNNRMEDSAATDGNEASRLVLRNDNSKVVVYTDEKTIKQHCLDVTEKYNLTNEDFDANLDNMFPAGETDKFGEQKDNRTHHSWTYKLPEVDTVELLETQMINNIAPTILVAQLMDMMQPTIDDSCNYEIDGFLTGKHLAYIVNVVSHEGLFNVDGKTDSHVHTNMSKAALNMLTRSAASYYSKKGILMNSADTGWVSSAIETFMDPPLDVQDGAYRILHPILTASLDYGKLYKNYHEIKW
ncbi:hypothetical protein C9374_003502 [Naegleria lovaniensis]|uniref:Uncharacterized protein n=1 Tax=Naegleria lovaniensis TaxID=51637 RepID=A0AA88GN17_NAELO|nr:uncharacterized protein C9374_003502 [Naegleria lovaniensis]KAG2385687.1 hypothetical protein C9374_003502 [Naegleria lovaniensis]